MKRKIHNIFFTIYFILIALSCSKETASTKHEPSVIAESSNVLFNSALITGKITLTSKIKSSASATLYFSRNEITLETIKSGESKEIETFNPDSTFSVVAYGLLPGTRYSYCVSFKIDEREYLSAIGSFTTKEYKAPELVDLGLSVKWASCNLGAAKPEEYGAYFQWGGTTDVSDCSIYVSVGNCPYHIINQSYKRGWTKYVYSANPSYWGGPGNPDEKTVLDPEDDAAHVNLGEKWRIPTVEEWTEIKDKNNCSWTWTTINGVHGYKIQSKKPGFTDKWIFLPAAGMREDFELRNRGEYGAYWSSTLHEYFPSDAYGIGFYVDGENGASMRFYGNSVRPVSE